MDDLIYVVILMRGAKVIDTKQLILALQFKGVVKLLFDNNHTSAWKTLKNLCIEKNLLFCILRSMLITKLAYLRFTCSSLSTLKTVVKVLKIFSGNKFL